MLSLFNPARHLVKAYKEADHEALTARHQAACQRQPDWECQYRAYKAFRRTLYQYRPMPFALVWRVAAGLLAAVVLLLIRGI